MGDYVPSGNSNFTEILKLKLPYLVSVCVSLPLQRFQRDLPVSSLPMCSRSAVASIVNQLITDQCW